ncbi:hypothetical protein Ddye_026750, partial [Dipteronia dyeriana]
MDIPMNLSNYLDATHKVDGSAYEYGSSWGENDNNLTWITIHKKGWRSGYCNPDPPEFL